MKVLHLISGGDSGGAKTHVITLLKRLIKDGVNIELLCIMEGGFTKEARQNGIPITIISQKNRYSLKPIIQIKNYIKNGKYDIVHCHGARANFIAFFIKKATKTPFITTLHSDYKLDFKDNLYKQAIFMPINAFALRKFDYILAVTNNFKNMLIQRKFNKDKIFVIYNGITLEESKTCIPKSEFLNHHNIIFDPNTVYVGTVARLQMVKGLQDILETAKELKYQKKLVFLIAGNGVLEKPMKEFIKENDLENVHMLGFIKDIHNFYNVIDINLLASYSESFPYALLEGSKFKKTTIATKVGGIPEMIKDKETGFLVQPHNYKDIVDKIQICINDREQMTLIGEKFYGHINKNFSDEQMAKTHIKIYDEIIKEIK